MPDEIKQKTRETHEPCMYCHKDIPSYNVVDRWCRHCGRYQGPDWWALVRTAVWMRVRGAPPSTIIVVAHFACEVVLQHALAKALRGKGVAEVAQVFSDFNLLSSLNYQQQHDIYRRVTRDEDKGWKSKKLWDDFEHLAKLRHDCVQEDHQVSFHELHYGWRMARDFVAHIEEVNGLR